MLVTYPGFQAFKVKLAEEHNTIPFWYQFIAEDCFAYITLFIALRYRTWDMRMGSLKLLVPVFSAFDRPIYQDLIPLQDILTIPSNVLHHLQKGSFSVRLSPTEWRAIALNKCHEMNINKNNKRAVVHPSKPKMVFLSNYLSFGAICIASLAKQIFPGRELRTHTWHKGKGTDGQQWTTLQSKQAQHNRVPSQTVLFTHSLPPQWAPDAAIVVGMLMIQTSPLPAMGTMQEYAQFLLNEYVRPHLRVRVKEIHVVFDNPGSMKETPKEIEHEGETAM